MHHACRIALPQERVEFGSELMCRFELSIRIKILTKGAVQGARNMACNRIQRFDFSPETWRTPRVNQALLLSA
jgi:hypothetical protein